jgi:hypothetical protein
MKKCDTRVALLLRRGRWNCPRDVLAETTI